MRENNEDKKTIKKENYYTTIMGNYNRPATWGDTKIIVFHEKKHFIDFYCSKHFHDIRDLLSELFLLR